MKRKLTATDKVDKTVPFTLKDLRRNGAGGWFLSGTAILDERDDVIGGIYGLGDDPYAQLRRRECPLLMNFSSAHDFVLWPCIVANTALLALV